MPLLTRIRSLPFVRGFDSNTRSPAAVDTTHTSDSDLGGYPSVALRVSDL